MTKVLKCKNESFICFVMQAIMHPKNTSHFTIMRTKIQQPLNGNFES